MRLIDADAANVDEINCYYGEDARLEDMQEWLDGQPTVEAPGIVRKAHWEICCDGYYPRCSNCKQEPQGRVTTDFCPNCGARMEGET